VHVRSPKAACTACGPTNGGAAVFAETKGGPNACAPAADGWLPRRTERLASTFSLFKLPGFDALPPLSPGDPGLQFVAPDGSVTYLATRVDDGTPMNAPNDLVVTADGTVYFTDPGHYPLPDPPIGRVLKMTRDGVVSESMRRTTTATALRSITRARCSSSRPPASCASTTTARGNGSSSSSAHRRRRLLRRRRGNAYVCCTTENCIKVIDPGGAQVERLDLTPLAANGMVTNCCFGGADGRTLFATHAIPGTVVSWDGLPHPGREVYPWPGWPPDRGPER
jgi:hypothetical protein